MDPVGKTELCTWKLHRQPQVLWEGAGKTYWRHQQTTAGSNMFWTIFYSSRSRASRKSNCLRGLSRSWLRLLPSKAFAMKNFLCRCKSHFKSILQLLIWFKPDDKQAQAAGEGEQGDQMLRAGWRPHPALPPGETLPSFCPETSSFKGNFLEAVMPSSIFLKHRDHLKNRLHRRLIGAAGALTLSQLSPCKVLEPPAALHRLRFHQVEAAFRNFLPYIANYVI